MSTSRLTVGGRKSSRNPRPIGTQVKLIKARKCSKCGTKLSLHIGPWGPRCVMVQQEGPADPTSSDNDYQSCDEGDVTQVGSIQADLNGTGQASGGLDPALAHFHSVAQSDLNPSNQTLINNASNPFVGNQPGRRPRT